MQSTLYYCQILMKFEYSRRIFENIQNFMKIRVVGAEFFRYGRTDGHDEANSHLSQFCECA
jgi:hypothetical protein